MDVEACRLLVSVIFLFIKQKTADKVRISDWSSDVCSSDLRAASCSTAASAEGAEPRASRRFACPTCASSCARSHRPFGVSGRQRPLPNTTSQPTATADRNSTRLNSIPSCSSPLLPSARKKQQPLYYHTLAHSSLNPDCTVTGWYTSLNHHLKLNTSNH